MDIDKLLTEKFLIKCKDRALDHKLEKVPKWQEGLWMERMWALGVVSTLIAFGYKILSKERFDTLMFERDQYKTLADSWMKDHDKLKAKYEPTELVIGE